MMNLLQRHCEPEIQDRPDLDQTLLVQALHGLERINYWCRSHQVFWPAICKLARQQNGRCLRILDVATGAGDIPVSLALQAQRAGIVAQFAGCDINPRSVTFARQHALRRSAPVQFFIWDAVTAPPPRRYDVVLCSLFLHHLADEQAIVLLKRMADAADHLVLISDLVRSAGGLAVAQVGTRLLRTSFVNRVDGARSVRSAFTLAEVRALLQRSGLDDAVIQRRWPCRFLVTWSNRRGKGEQP